MPVLVDMGLADRGKFLALDHRRRPDPEIVGWLNTSGEDPLRRCASGSRVYSFLQLAKQLAGGGVIVVLCNLKCLGELRVLTGGEQLGRTFATQSKLGVLSRDIGRHPRRHESHATACSTKRTPCTLEGSRAGDVERYLAAVAQEGVIRCLRSD